MGCVRAALEQLSLTPVVNDAKRSIMNADQYKHTLCSLRVSIPNIGVRCMKGDTLPLNTTLMARDRAIRWSHLPGPWASLSAVHARIVSARMASRSSDECAPSSANFV